MGRPGNVAVTKLSVCVSGKNSEPIAATQKHCHLLLATSNSRCKASCGESWEGVCEQDVALGKKRTNLARSCRKTQRPKARQSSRQLAIG
eukprot:755778-Amphidinium_carterae.1